MSSVSRKIAEDLVRWYAAYGCDCKYSRRLATVLGSLGGGVDAASVRSRANAPASGASRGVNPRVVELIETVLLERSLSGPDLAAAAFDLNDKISYCPCNASRSNCDVTSFSVWETKNGGALKATCPSCTLEIACSDADSLGEDEGNESRPVGPVALTALLRKRAEEEADPARAETKRLWAALMLGGTSGGRGSCSQATHKSSFGGSWTSLLFECDRGSENGRRLRLKSEVLVSNSIKQSVRLQPNCVCSDLLYAVCSAAGERNCAYRVRDLEVLGGEFLYFSYVLFEEGGVFDAKAHMCDLVATEPASEVASLGAPPRGPEGDDARQPPRKKNRPDADPTDKMTTDNEVDVQTLLMTVLAGHRAPDAASVPRKRTKKRTKGSVRGDAHREARGTVGAVNDTITLAAGRGRGDSETRASPSEKCEKDVVLPCPQICEQSFAEHLRSRPPGPDVIHTSRLGGACFKMPARIFRKHFLLPWQSVLFSPPVVVRVNFNRYRVLTGLSTFFDRVEVVGTPGAHAGVRLDVNAAHGAVLRMLARLRENSVRRSLEAGVSEGAGRFGLLLKNPSTNLGMRIPSKEIRARRLGAASTLGMLAGMAA
uniref:Wsv440-like protein n=1 Tax=Sicyonia whispovirus TaxID=2984283 RepID=A0A9C7BWY5_9VIRU|nr:MAG: wsv440-like protein [Sicyonia whispovirus]